MEGKKFFFNLSNRWTIAYFIVVGSLPLLKKALTSLPTGASGTPDWFSLTRAGRSPRHPQCRALLASSSSPQPEDPGWLSSRVTGLCSESKSLTISGSKDGVRSRHWTPAGQLSLPRMELPIFSHDPLIPSVSRFGGSQGKHKGQVSINLPKRATYTLPPI